jgi:hypothetical protein
MRYLILFFRLLLFAAMVASSILFGLRVAGCISVEMKVCFAPLLLPLVVGTALCGWLGVIDAVNATARFARRCDRAANWKSRPSRSERRARRVRR